MLRWTDYLEVDSIRLSLQATDRDGVLKELAGLMAARARVPERELASALVARERLGSTAMPGGVAVPHCRLARVPRIVTCVGIHPGGLHFGDPEDAPVHIFVGLVSPPDTAGLHLNVLARISSLLREPSLRTALLRAPSALEAHALLVRTEYSLRLERRDLHLTESVRSF
ncbi:PTS sugar transporter subunit IIA [Pyxidicoccus xibeiensis]|uniref:PTS sugar transporter subunit IIA n=1 Tax=Pyxidicoccus xibeiensis TaxID=2906759 RepID=UPI0020A7A8AD|nr:PTS sugar transporter subunit IIA [Pyxidicoccus xibeiensis]MCP3136861.1 PTS sugar transporter subunit IIA [Pyxidicoccus xibeiensis]